MSVDKAPKAPNGSPLLTAVEPSATTQANTDYTISSTGSQDHSLSGNTEIIAVTSVGDTMLMRLTTGASSSNWDIVLPDKRKIYVPVSTSDISIYSPNGGTVYIREV